MYLVDTLLLFLYTLKLLLLCTAVFSLFILFFFLLFYCLVVDRNILIYEYINFGTNYVYPPSSAAAAALLHWKICWNLFSTLLLFSFVVVVTCIFTALFGLNVIYFTYKFSYSSNYSVLSAQMFWEELWDGIGARNGENDGYFTWNSKCYVVRVFCANSHHCDFWKFNIISNNFCILLEKHFLLLLFFFEKKVKKKYFE